MPENIDIDTAAATAGEWLIISAWNATLKAVVLIPKIRQARKIAICESDAQGRSAAMAMAIPHMDMVQKRWRLRLNHHENVTLPRKPARP